jgi:hypothetical protein
MKNREKEEKYLSGNRKYLSFSLSLFPQHFFQRFVSFDISIERISHANTNSHMNVRKFAFV